MTQEEKQLVFNDICARLPYGVVVECTHIQENNGYTSKLTPYTLYFVLDDNWSVKPYLRPISSMTEEEKEEYCNLQDKFLYSSQYPVTDAFELFDWLNRNGFDYRGLIPTGLALEATEGMYKIG